ncbi:high mobility group B protein 14 [Eutrema salsugineum]|uniref:high mobility group B protein 14 n=1 Tax=Eutrema salsugineum TaxID=72664 RepID=UPI000CED47B0|nr:high mobility group B protein 14 [Eutrema salsugineum]
MTKKAPKSGISRPSSPSCSGGSGRNVESAVKSSEDARRSTRLRLQPLRKPKTSQKKKKKPAKLHSKMPKKPPTAFFYFLEDFRKQYQEQNPEIKSMREIGKTCGEKWKTMTYEEKVKYYDIATEKREEFQRAMTEYTKRMESGEYDESETDSNFSE